MNTQTFQQNKTGYYVPSEIQVVRNSVKKVSKQVQETKSISVNDLRGLSWIMFEEYN